MNVKGFIHYKSLIDIHIHRYIYCDSYHKINVHKNYVIITILQKIIMEVMLQHES